MTGRRRTTRRAGQALIEASLLLPMLLFLFLGMTNVGFFVYAFISVGNAARVGAQRTAYDGLAGFAGPACDAVLPELQSLPNVNLTCTGDLIVTARKYTEALFNTEVAEVTVSYQTIQMFPLPFMSGKMTINRTASMPLLPHNN